VVLERARPIVFNQLYCCLFALRSGWKNRRKAKHFAVEDKQKAFVLMIG
jgi:hypothetical protein